MILLLRLLFVFLSAAPLAALQMSIADKITLHRNHETHEMLMAQVCSKNLKRIFQVDPDQVWLRDLDNGTAYFPEADGQFNLKDLGVKYYQDLAVEGPAVTAAPCYNRPASLAASTSSGASGSSSLAGVPSLPPLISPIAKANTTRGNFALKITKATLHSSSGSKAKHGIEFQPICQIYVDINEQVANVTYIKACVQKKWGCEYTIVTSDGVELEDCPGTEGLAFWKAPKRRFYAIAAEKEDDEKPMVAGRKRNSPTEGDECKKKLNTNMLLLIKQEVQNLNELKDTVEEIHTNMKDLLAVNEKMMLPVGLHRSLGDTFTCKICKNLMKPPLIYSKCCKSVIGCESCINKWYTGDEALTKVCPLCGSARGYNETAQIMGFDDFIGDVNKILLGQSQQENCSHSD